VEGAWRSADSVIEDMNEVFLSAVKDANVDEEVPKGPPVNLDLPEWVDRPGVGLTEEYRKAIHYLIDEDVPVMKIHRRYKISTVTIRFHRDEECACREKGLVG